MRSTPIGGRPFPGFGYIGSMRAHSSRQGTTRSISARNCARRVIFVYFSKPVPASVACERFFISTSRSRVMWLVASQHTTRESGGLIQRFLSSIEPCPMCFARLLAAGVQTVKFLAEDAWGGMVNHRQHLPAAWQRLGQRQAIRRADVSASLRQFARDVFLVTLDACRQKLWSR